MELARAHLDAQAPIGVHPGRKLARHAGGNRVRDQHAGDPDLAGAAGHLEDEAGRDGERDRVLQPAEDVQAELLAGLRATTLAAEPQLAAVAAAGELDRAVGERQVD